MTIIVPDAQVAQARELCEQLAGAAGAGMFSAQLSADGQAPATHWCSSGAIGEEFAAALSDPAVMLVACQQAGIAITLEECASILGSAEIVELGVEDVRATFERLGLELMEQALKVIEQPGRNKVTVD